MIKTGNIFNREIRVFKTRNHVGLVKNGRPRFFEQGRPQGDRPYGVGLAVLGKPGGHFFIVNRGVSPV